MGAIGFREGVDEREAAVILGEVPNGEFNVHIVIERDLAAEHALLAEKDRAEVLLLHHLHIQPNGLQGIHSLLGAEVVEHRMTQVEIRVDVRPAQVELGSE